MEKKKNFKRLFSGVIIGGLLLSSGGLVIADDQTTDQSNSKPAIQRNQFPGKGGGPMMEGLSEDTLAALVSAGTITQEQADQILALAKANAAEQKAQAEKFANMTEEERAALREEQKAKGEEFKNLSEEERQALKDEQKDKKADLFSQAVYEGIITQAEADAINKSRQEKAQQERQQGMQSKIDELVNQGTITSEQAATILENMSKKQTMQKSNQEKTKKTTTQKDQTSIKQNQGERPTPFKDLVEDGTLTQDQADSVGKAMQPPGGGGHGGPGGPGRR